MLSVTIGPVKGYWSAGNLIYFSLNWLLHAYVMYRSACYMVWHDDDNYDTNSNGDDSVNV